MRLGNVLACVCGLCGAMSEACISSAPIVPETAANQAQISSCQNTASWHNDLVVGDFVFGGGATAASAVAGAVSSDNTARTAAVITAAGLAALATGTGGLTAFTASDFANGNCSSVVGPLPTLPAKPQ